eukprot:6119493-Prymnesium_polylepis.1
MRIHESGASVRASRAHGRMITHTSAPSGARADATACAENGRDRAAQGRKGVSEGARGVTKPP